MDRKFVLARSLAAMYLLERGGSAEIEDLLSYLSLELGAPLSYDDVFKVLNGLITIRDGEASLNENGKTFAILMAPWFVRKLRQLEPGRQLRVQGTT